MGHRDPSFGRVVETKRHKLPWRGREPSSVHPLADLMFPTMRTPEITTQLTPANFFEKFAGMRHVYETTIDDGVSKVVGCGPSSEASGSHPIPNFQMPRGGLLTSSTNG
jgi:hypothetical protein